MPLTTEERWQEQGPPLAGALVRYWAVHFDVPQGGRFKVSTNGVLASWYSFTGGNDSASPQAGLGRAIITPLAMRWPSGEKATDITVPP